MDAVSSMRIKQLSERCCEYEFVSKKFLNVYDLMCGSRGSNRRRQDKAASVKKQTTRAVHALTRHHGPSFTKNGTIRRLIELSATRRLRRFKKEGRKQKLLVKIETAPGAPITAENVNEVPVHITPEPTVADGTMAAEALPPKHARLKTNKRAQEKKELEKKNARREQRMKNSTKPNKKIK